MARRSVLDASRRPRLEELVSRTDDLAEVAQANTARPLPDCYVDPDFAESAHCERFSTRREPPVKRLVATLGAVTAAIGFGMPICPPAQADPFVRCPYDPSVPGAQMQYINQKTAQLIAFENDVNTRILGPLSNAQRDAFAKSPAGLEILAKGRQIEEERDNLPQSCFPLPTAASAPPYFNPQPLQPVQKPPVLGNDIQPANHSCADLNSAWEKAGKLSAGADLLLAIKKLPGFGDVEAGQLIGCGIGQTIAGSPGDANVGMCNGVAALDPIPLPNPCPAG